MISLTWLIVSLCITTIYATQNDPGPQYFAQSTPAPARLTPEYIMKDVILYLTPSQIRALEATRGLNKVVPFGKPSEENVKLSNDDLQKLEAELNRQLEHLRIYEKQNERLVEVKAPPPIVEPNTEKPIAFAPDFNQEQQRIPEAKPQQEHNYFLPDQELRAKLPESYTYIKFFTDNVAQEKSRIQVFQPFPRDIKLSESLEKNLEIHRDPIHQQHYKLVPYEFAEKTSEQLKQELISQVPQWPNLFSQLHSGPSLSHQITELIKAQTQELEQKDSEIRNQLSEIRYAAKFDDHKQAADFQRFVTKIEQENAQVHAEALKKSPAEIIKKEETIIKRKPISVFKQYNTPVFKPFYITASNSFALKAPQTYQIPIRVVDAFPTLKTQHFEEPKGVTLEVERYVPAELKKDERFEISENNPEKTTTLRHVWKN